MRNTKIIDAAAVTVKQSMGTGASSSTMSGQEISSKRATSSTKP